MIKRVTTSTIKRMKQDQHKIAMLTAYDYPTAKIIDQAGVDIVLVGDSLGMVVLGYEDTTQVTMDDMIHHTKAVARGVSRALVVTDMPFLSYHMGIYKSVENAGRIIQEGRAQAVKLEGGEEIVNDVKAIIKSGIPVMGHLGLTPQSIHNLGGYYVQGKTEEQAKKLLYDAKALEAAGVFSIVLELMPEELAAYVSSQLTIPTIGIGAGMGCDGQVLVVHDMLGLYQGKTPKFVKVYDELGGNMEKAVLSYVHEVKDGTFPKPEHSFHVDKENITTLYGGKQ